MAELRLEVTPKTVITWETTKEPPYIRTRFWIDGDEILIVGESDDWEHAMRELCGPAFELDEEIEGDYREAQSAQ